jgi:type IV secretory pathway VirJ component
MRKFLLVLLLCGAAPVLAAQDHIEFGRFGKVAVYRPAKIEQVVIFISGDGGWELGVLDMAELLRRRGALVLGVDITRYFRAMRASKDECWYAAADFEELSQYAQKDLGLPQYIRPVLAGFSSGATLAYAILAQAPPDTFRGGLSLGFCPDLETPRPLCKGSALEHEALPKGKGFVYKPAPLAERWVAFQGLADKVCDPAVTEAFVRDVRGGDIVLLEKVGHGFGVQSRWVPQFTEAYARLTAPEKPAEAPAAVSGLPLIEHPAKSVRPYFAVIISGDGGWAGIDRQVASALVKDGVPVVGLDSLKYFWTPRSPEILAADLARVISHYSAAWGKDRVVLVGYSRGADVAAFAANRLPREQKDRVALLALLAPARKAEFEFHLSDWLGGAERGAPVKPEVEAWKGSPLVCFYGKAEKDSLCPDLDPRSFILAPLGGGHHFGGAYAEIAARILKEIR